MTDRQSVAANTTVTNVLAGKLFEFANVNSIARLYATGSAVGLNISFVIGDQVVLDDQEVSSANRFPIVPDDFISQGGALRGDRMVIRLRNTTGGAITSFTRLDVDPVGG
jgi:hypothetical protein